MLRSGKPIAKAAAYALPSSSISPNLVRYPCACYRSCSSASTSSTTLARPSFRAPARNFATAPKVLSASSTTEAESSLASALPSFSEQSAYYGPFPTRSHPCGELRPSDAGQHVILTGWLQSARTVSKHLGFLTLFDHSGKVQLKVHPSSIQDAADADPTSTRSSLPLGERDSLESLFSIPLQSAVLIKGTVGLRPTQDAKQSEPTGQVEVLVQDFTLLNPANRRLPFLPSDSSHSDNIPPETRAKYRYLDLRRPSLANNIRLRSKVTHAVRNHLHDQGFLEIETPILLRSTPEGAREFLVPTRVSSSADTTDKLDEPAFYALPQSPQQPKQLLIASGVTDKYFQIAKCFRDEDGRKDRQPEFTQIDLEMGFISGGPVPSIQRATDVEGSQKVDDRDAQGQWRLGGEQVRKVIEGLVRRIWQVTARGDLPETFPVMSYWNAMTQYGSDKPDLRYDLRIHDISPGFKSSSDLSPLEARKHSLEILPHHHDSKGKLSNKEVHEIIRPFEGKVERFRISSQDNVNELAALLLKKSALTRKFLSSLVGDDDGIQASDVDVDILTLRLKEALQSSATVADDKDQPVDVYVSLRADPPVGGSTSLGEVRKRLAEHLISKKMLEVTGDSFVWITEFPLFTQADEDKNLLSSISSGSSSVRWQSSHHPFTAPLAEDIPLLLNSSTSSSSSSSRRMTLTDEVIAKIRGQHYDLVLNGQEIGGGSVRIHSKNVQELVFREILNLTDSERRRFNHLIHALDCGAPPHAGIALGFDRLMAILCNAESIRDVIAFPKQGSGVDPLFGSPAPLPEIEGQDASTPNNDLLRLYGLAKARPNGGKSR